MRIIAYSRVGVSPLAQQAVMMGKIIAASEKEALQRAIVLVIGLHSNLRLLLLEQ